MEPLRLDRVDDDTGVVPLDARQRPIFIEPDDAPLNEPRAFADAARPIPDLEPRLHVLKVHRYPRLTFARSMSADAWPILHGFGMFGTLSRRRSASCAGLAGRCLHGASVALSFVTLRRS